MAATHTVAMWSGPRNVSTAMMRAWENRPDTVVSDEPLYAYYLTKTQRNDPMAADIIASGETDYQQVVNTLTTPPADGLQYHKHITTHILPGDSLSWLTHNAGMKHVFLIREPARVVASFSQLMNPTDKAELEDFIGFHQQRHLYEHIKKYAASEPWVIDSTRFLSNPRFYLQTLCEHLNIPFYDHMLSWPAGSRNSDGVWASHWYRSVNKSTGFGPPAKELPTLNAGQSEVADRCQDDYLALLAHAL